MSEVPQSWRSVLDALTRRPSAWQTPSEVARRLGRDLEETTDILAALDLDGLILVREPEGAAGPIVAPSPKALERAARFRDRDARPRRLEPALSF